MVMLLSSYNHEPLSGESYDDSQALNQQAGDMLTPTQAATGAAAATSAPPSNCSMQEHALKPGSDQQGSVCNPARALRIKPQPNQVLKCPRCNSLNTKFCYYNNYSLSQPRHFCKNCRRYWTKGGALRNVPVGGGCRKNKRAKQKNSDHSSSANASNGDKSGGSFSGGDPLGARHGPLLGAGCSTSGLFDLSKDEDGGIGLPYSRLAHTMRLSDHSGTSSGLSFEIPRGSNQPLSFSSLPLSLPAFDAGLPAGTLNFQGLMKQEHGGGAGGAGLNSGDFSSMYDPSLNLLGPASSAAQAVAPLTEGLSTFNLGLENFVGLGLNGDMKWRQQQQHQQQAPKIASLLDPEHHHHGHHHHHHHHHPGLLHQLEDTEGLVAAGRSSSNKAKSVLLDEAAAASHGSPAPEWQQQQHHHQHHHQQQQQQSAGAQQQQQQDFMESSGGDATYWNGTGWPLIDLPMYVDQQQQQQQQYCDVKSVEQVAVPDYYSSRATTAMSRCTPSLT